MPSRSATLPDRWRCDVAHESSAWCSCCRTRALVYGSRDARRHGGVGTLPTSDAIRESRRTAIELLSLYLTRPEWEERCRLTLVGMRLEAWAKTKPEDRLSRRIYERVIAHGDAMRRTLILCEGWECFLASPVPGEPWGIEKSRSGQWSAMSRLWIRVAESKQSVLRVQRTYRALREMVQIPYAAARPYLDQVRAGHEARWLRKVQWTLNRAKRTGEFRLCGVKPGWHPPSVEWLAEWAARRRAELADGPNMWMRREL